LREKIERLRRGKRITARQELSQIAHLRRRIAGNVDDGARRESEELAEERRVATLPRRIDDHDRVVRFERRGVEPRKDRGSIAGGERRVVNVVGRGIFAGETHAAFADLDSGDMLKCGCRAEREQTAPAIRIDQKSRPARRRLLADIARERGQDEGIVLEKIAREEMQLQRRFACALDSFGNHRVKIRRHLSAGLAQQDSGAALVVVLFRMNRFTDCAELEVNRFGRDRALRHIDDVEPRALPEEPDRNGFSAARGGLKCGVIFER
jgi:hypothetical protein